MKLFHFFQDSKWYEDVAHCFIPPLIGWIREWRQDPPGDPLYVVAANFEDGQFFVDATHKLEQATQILNEYGAARGRIHTFYPKDRCDDRMRDFFGYAVCSVWMTVVLVGLLIWRW